MLGGAVAGYVGFSFGLSGRLELGVGAELRNYQARVASVVKHDIAAVPL